jgi:hypothetical protein
MRPRTYRFSVVVVLAVAACAGARNVDTAAAPASAASGRTERALSEITIPDADDARGNVSPEAEPTAHGT